MIFMVDFGWLNCRNKFLKSEKRVTILRTNRNGVGKTTLLLDAMEKMDMKHRNVTFMYCTRQSICINLTMSLMEEGHNYFKDQVNTRYQKTFSTKKGNVILMVSRYEIEKNHNVSYGVNAIFFDENTYPILKEKQDFRLIPKIYSIESY